MVLNRSFWPRAGHEAEQTTLPQALVYSLADSPKWIYERLVSWTNDYPSTDDEGQRI